MRLSQDRFYNGNVTKRFYWKKGLPDEIVCDTIHDTFSYEASNAFYSVHVRRSDGYKTYHFNCGFDSGIKPIHKAIEKHFGV